MKNEKISQDHNLFYSSIAKYYSDIFPYNPGQLNFVKNKLQGTQNQRILDIGCATGELSFQLAQKGYEVIGIDLNDDLIEQAKIRESENLVYQVGNMLELSWDYPKNHFDAVICFGNTLVHLSGEEQIRTFIKGASAVLKKGGYLLLQILNYDHIFQEEISELPLIETERIRFIRKYSFKENSEFVSFNTELHIKDSDQKVSNSTLLYGLKSKQLENLLREVGFSNIRFYANFKGERFSGAHLPLVLECSK